MGILRAYMKFMECPHKFEEFVLDLKSESMIPIGFHKLENAEDKPVETIIESSASSTNSPKMSVKKRDPYTVQWTESDEERVENHARLDTFWLLLFTT